MQHMKCTDTDRDASNLLFFKTVLTVALQLLDICRIVSVGFSYRIRAILNKRTGLIVLNL